MQNGLEDTQVRATQIAWAWSHSCLLFNCIYYVDFMIGTDLTSLVDHSLIISIQTRPLSDSQLAACKYGPFLPGCRLSLLPFWHESQFLWKRWNLTICSTHAIKTQSWCAEGEFLLARQADINPVMATCSRFFILERFKRFNVEPLLNKMFHEEKLKSIHGSTELRCYLTCNHT